MRRCLRRPSLPTSTRRFERRSGATAKRRLRRYSNIPTRATATRGRLGKKSSPLRLRKLHLYVLAVRVCGLEQRMGLEVHHACDEGVRNGGNADVEGVHVLVEQAAVRGDLLLEGGNALLELEKVGVGLQVGILFGDRKERAQGAGDH